MSHCDRGIPSSVRRLEQRPCWRRRGRRDSSPFLVSSRPFLRRDQTSLACRKGFPDLQHTHARTHTHLMTTRNQHLSHCLWQMKDRQRVNIKNRVESRVKVKIKVRDMVKVRVMVRVSARPNPNPYHQSYFALH